MINKINLQIKNNFESELDTDVYLPPGTTFKTPFLIFCSWFQRIQRLGRFSAYMMEKLTEAGYTGVSFNFSYNGVEKNNPTEFTRLDFFAKNNFSRELEDLHCIIDYFYDNSDKYNLDREKIVL